MDDWKRKQLEDLDGELDDDLLDEDLTDDQGQSSKWSTRIGCLFLSIYFLMAIFEMFAIYDWLIWRFELNGFLSAFASMFLAFIPGLGSLLAYWGATEVWEWESMTAIAAFFWYFVPMAFYFFIAAGAVFLAILMIIKGKIMR